MQTTCGQNGYFPITFEILAKSLRGCQKWILQKILHRSSDPKKSQLLFFIEKNNFEILKNKYLGNLKKI